MNLLESVRIALAGLASNRLRSFLTMLGIVIGVGAVIALVSFGQGVERYISAQFESLGSNLLFVYTQIPPGEGVGDIEPITMADVELIANPAFAPSVLRVAPQYDVFSIITAGRNSAALTVNGITSDYEVVRDWHPRDGRFIEEEDVVTRGRVAVLGSSTAGDLFDEGIDPVGQTIRINNIPFRVIGVMEERSSSSFGDENEVIFVPITTAQTRLTRAWMSRGSYQVGFLNVQAVSKERMESAADEITRILNERHNVQFQDEQDFVVLSQDELLSVVGQITGLLTIFLAVIAGISLLVGGIGIMNIMLVTVTERTREIGLRKAVGARRIDILMQFLIESVVLTVTGGLIGIGLGILAAFAGTHLAPDLTLVVTPDAILLATAVSTAIGLFFGIYPASRAAALNPIDALRYE